MKSEYKVIKLLAVIFPCLLLYACPGSSSPDAHAPAVAHDPVNGRYLAVYLKVTEGNPDAGGSGKSSGVAGVFVDNNGSQLGKEFEISGDTAYYYCPSIAFDSAHMRYFVVWYSKSGSSDNPVGNIFGQFINSDGSLSGSRLTLSNTATTLCGGRCAGVTYDDINQKFAAAWGEENASDRDNMYAQLINADGSLDGPKLAVSADGALPTHPSIAYDRQLQRFFVVWESADNRQIKGRMINPDGTFVASEFLISSATGTHFVPTVAYNSVDARFLVSWERTMDNSTFDLLGQLLNSDGSLYQSPINISSPGRNLCRHASVYNPSDNNYFVLLCDRSQELIYTQIVKSDGTLDTSVSADNILISYADYPSDREPAAAYDSINNRFFSVWEYTGGYYDIHGRLVNANGSPAGDISVVASGGN